LFSLPEAKKAFAALKDFRRKNSIISIEIEHV